MVTPFARELGKPGILYKITKSYRAEKRGHRMAREELQKWQLNRLQQIVSHAYRHVPVYRKKWDEAGVSPKDIVTLKDIEKLPILTKNDLISHYPDGILADNISRSQVKEFATTGSTGSSVRIFYDLDMIVKMMVQLSRLFASFYLSKRIRKVSRIVVSDEDSMEALSSRHRNSPDFSMMDARESVEKLAAFICEGKPDIIVSYPGVMAELARYVMNNKLRVPKPEAVGLGGETLSAQSRRLIEEAFQTKVYTGYAATECGLIAAEGPHSSLLKVWGWNNYVELVDDFGNPTEPGETGNVIVTNFVNKATPIIRYSGLGDLARFAKRDEGSGLYIEAIEGRVAHSIIRPDGKKIHPFVLTTVLQEIESITQYQIKQHSINDLEILVVLSEHAANTGKAPFTEGCPDRNKILDKYREILGEGLNIRFSIVNSIPTKEGTHKVPLVINSLGN